MEDIFETNEEIYKVLGYEKCGLVLGKNLYLPDCKRGNTNTLIVAGGGTGKSAGFSIPNVLNMLGSYVVTDPLGEIYEKTNKYLKENGYTVKTINYEKCLDNYNYNPLNHINSDADIDILTDIIIGHEEDEFWQSSSKSLLKAVIYYVMKKEEKKDLLTCFNLLSLDRYELLGKLEELPRDSMGSKYYFILKSLPEKTYYSAVSTAILKFTFVINNIPEDRNYIEKFDFKELSNNKMAIFLISSKNDDEKYINIFLSQLLSQIPLSNNGTEKIYFILDEINKFDKIRNLPTNLEMARTKNISINLLTNNLEKLKKIYGDDFGNIINAIDTHMFYGALLKYDIDYFSELTGIDSKFLRYDLKNDRILIYEKNLKPILADKMYFFEKEEWKNI